MADNRDLRIVVIGAGESPFPCENLFAPTVLTISRYGRPGDRIGVREEGVQEH